jgi:hypothetical protein
MSVHNIDVTDDETKTNVSMMPSAQSCPLGMISTLQHDNGDCKLIFTSTWHVKTRGLSMWVFGSA